MTRRIIAAIAVGLLILAIAVWGPAACRSFFTAKKEVRVSKGQAGAAVDAGAEAMNTVSNTMASEGAADREFEETRDEIRKAPPEKRGTLTLDASCRLRHNQHKQRCARLPAAGSANASGGG